MIQSQDDGPDTSVYPLEPHWHTAIRSAVTEEELLFLARVFMRIFTAEAYVRLPAEFRPRLRAWTAGEVCLLTFRLKSIYCSKALVAEEARCIERLVGFFEALAERIFEVRAIRPEERLSA